MRGIDMAVKSKTMPAGTALIPFTLPDVDGRSVNILDYRDNLLLVVFTCNHCPYAKASWPTLIDLQKRYAKDGFQAVAVNPNNNPAYPDDRFEAMKPYAEAIGLNFPYLFDADQKAASAYGAECTPDPYLFKDGALYYHGRISDNWQNPEAVKEKNLENAVLAALGRGQLPGKIFPSIGCSIKWVA